MTAPTDPLFGVQCPGAQSVRTDVGVQGPQWARYTVDPGSPFCPIPPFIINKPVVTTADQASVAIGVQGILLGDDCYKYVMDFALELPGPQSTTDLTFWAITTTDGTADPSIPNYISKATASVSAGNASVIVSLPVGTFEGYLLVAAVAQGANSPAVSTPAGWTLLALSNGTDCALSIFYKIQQKPGTETATHTFTSSSGTPALSAAIYGFSFSARPEDFVTANGSGIALTATGPTTRYNARTVLAIYSNASSTVAVPGAMVTNRGGIGANSVGVTAGSITVPKAAPTGAFTATQGSAVGWAEVLVVIPHTPVGHSWVEAIPTGPAGFIGGGGFIPLPGGRSGSISSSKALYEASSGRGLPRGTVMRVWPVTSTSGYTGTGTTYEGVPLGTAPAVMQSGVVEYVQGSPVGDLTPMVMRNAIDPDANPMSWNTNFISNAWAAGLQAEPLVGGQRYLGTVVGIENDGKPVFAVTPIGVSATTTNNGTGDVTYPSSPIWFTVLSIDQASGLKFVGNGTIQAQDASITHKGVVSIGTQTFAGSKKFVPDAGGGYDWRWQDSQVDATAGGQLIFHFLGAGRFGFEFWNPSGGVGAYINSLEFLPGNSSILGFAAGIFWMYESNFGKPTWLRLTGSDGLGNGSGIIVMDSLGAERVGVSETLPAGKQPIFVGGVYVGHTP